MKTYDINDILNFALKVNDDWHYFHRWLNEVCADESLGRIDRLQKGFHIFSEFYVRVGRLLAKYDVTNFQED